MTRELAPPTETFNRRDFLTYAAMGAAVCTPCPVCGTAIVKEAYLGGSIYYCKKCQMI
jgi:formamidopyrimidine-DNA glycosylase